MTPTEYLRQAFRLHRTSQPICHSESLATFHGDTCIAYVCIPHQIPKVYAKELDARYQNAYTFLRMSTS
jgi:hypothetical protein